MLIIAIIVLAIVLLLLLSRPRRTLPTQWPLAPDIDAGDTAKSGHIGAADSPASGASDEQKNEFKPGGGDFGGGGSSGRWGDGTSGDGGGDGD